MRQFYHYKHKLLGLLFVVFAMMGMSVDASAQCNPTFTGDECVGSAINFFANAPGYDNYAWDFGDGPPAGTSSDRNPTYNFGAPGTYTVTLTATDAVLPKCTKTVVVKILPSPEVNVSLISPLKQCYNGNYFCFADSSKPTPGSKIVRATYLFSDGDLYEEINPTFPRTFCKDNEVASSGKSVIDKRGGWFNLKIQLEDANGCITEVTIDSMFRVFPHLGVNISASGAIGCDSTSALIVNKTYLDWLNDPEKTIGLKDVAWFEYDFGDGDSNIVRGDSVTNTKYWTGQAFDAKILKKYYATGTFDATLTVMSKWGCKESFTYRAAATNYAYRPEIIADPDSSCADKPEVQFKLKDGPIAGAKFLWNFGDPPSGPLNTDNKNWEPKHNYGSGPWMISLRIVVGPCDLMVYDTITKIGPLSTIEVPFVRVAEHEKYQCVIKDSVHFVNNSVFYHDDAIWQDEDSIVWKFRSPTDSFPRYVFNFDTATRSGDQTAIPNANQIRNKDHVLRIWTLGDNYAPKCTTDTKANKNVGLNCNFTLDSLPVHWYTPWDEIYYTNTRGRFYKRPSPRTLFSRNARRCFQVQVYADSIVYIPPRLTMGFPAKMAGEVATDSFLRTQFVKYRTDLFTEIVGVNQELLVPELETRYIYVAAGDSVVNKSGATGDIFNLNVVPTAPATSAKGPGFYKIVGKLGGSPMVLKTPNSAPDTIFWVMHEKTEIIYDTLRNCYAGPIIHTMTLHDQDFDVPSGVTVKVKDLNNGKVTDYTGPKTLTIEKDFQFQIETTDSICPVFWSDVDKFDRVVAQPSTFIVDTVINGVDSFIQFQQIVIDSAYHRNYFYLNQARCNSVTLWHKDTVHPFMCESSNNISLALIPPNARGLKWESGTPCVVVPGAPFNPAYYLTFSMQETKPGCTQQWFEVNYDSLAGINNWVPFNSGGVLAPPPPGIPIPFIMPYQIVGAYGTKFVKAYSPKQVNIPGVKRLQGSFTIGLVIGNGPPTTNSQGQKIAPTCTDTAWYSDMFQIKFMDPTFEVILPIGDKKKMCVGDSAYLRVLNPVQEEIKEIAVFWNVDDGTLESADVKRGVYQEIYNYYQEYDGPKTGRNDQGVNWSPSDKWLYTYVERNNYSYKKSTSTNQIVDDILRDTLVTRIFRDWEVRADTRRADDAIVDAFKQLGLDIRDIDPADVPLYLGDGTFGCIDTTGISQLFTFYIAPIEKNVVTHGKYKYHFTNHDQTDSVIIEEIFHFRDSSLIGYDYAIAPTSFTTMTPKDTLSFRKGDTIKGLWKMKYQYPVLVPDPCDPDPALSTLAWKPIRGVVHNYIRTENRDGCNTSIQKDIIVGFFSDNRLAEEAVCKGTPVRIKDSIRYFTDNVLDPNYPLYQKSFWEDPARYAIKEFKYVDWDAEDGKDDYETSIVFSHVYDDPGTYVINYAMKDSNACEDTIQLVAYVTGILANFEHNAGQLACDNIVSFYDSTVVFDPCRGRDTCPNPGYEPCDSIIFWEWDFGDGSRTSFLRGPSHDYTSSGWFTVKLKVKSLLGCEDSVEKQIFIPGPQPDFEIRNNPWGPDSIIVCVGDSVALNNLARDPMYNPQWVFRWGDSSVDNSTSTTDVNEIVKHQYNTAGVYYLSVFMQDDVPGVSGRCTKVFPDTSTKDGKIPRQIKVIVMPITPASFIPKDTTVCPDEPIVFKSTSDSIYTRLVWSMGDGDTLTRNIDQDGDTLTHSYSSPGTYTVVLKPDYDLPPGDFGPKCLDTDTGKVTVENVKADFNIEHEEFTSKFCFKDASTNAVKWTWRFEDQGQQYFYKTEQNPCYDWGERVGEYEVCLYVENSNGCTDTVCKMIKNDFRASIKVYNVFTPAGSESDDGYNNVFVVDVESHEEYEIKIFNRWGELVFENTDPNVHWDGTIMNNGKECPAGTYFYIINYKLRSRPYNDGLGPIEGTVTLIRD